VKSEKIHLENQNNVPPPPCAEPGASFSCTTCPHCHTDGEDGGGLYCDYRDTTFVF